MATGTDFILDALLREGLDHLFMVPGGLVDPFLPALARHPGLKPIVAAHEGGATYMADVLRARQRALRRRARNWRPWPLQYGDRGRRSEDGFLSGAHS
jgi:thiamine pyrophosphate-dependent enzyme